MSISIAIPCKNGIIIAADGMSVDCDTGEIRPPVNKIFQITHNSALAITGVGIIDEFDAYMLNLTTEVKIRKHSDIDNIAEDVKEIIDKRGWAEYKNDKDRSHMGVIVVGYADEVKIYGILDNRDMRALAYCAMGSWTGATSYLVDNVSKNLYDNEFKSMDKVTIKLLAKAAVTKPESIGRPFMLWHVLPHGIRKLDNNEISKLEDKYSRTKI